MIQAHFTGQKIYSNASEAFSLYEKSRFGEKSEGKIEYSLVEALFLLEKQKIKIVNNKKEIGLNDFFSKIKRIDKKIDLKYAVFKDLRKKGYILKTALKFGADFRVYEKGSSPGQEHALWLLHVFSQNSAIKSRDFAAINRIATSTRKKIIIAIVDEESSVSYYETNWLKLQ